MAVFAARNSHALVAAAAGGGTSNYSITETATRRPEVDAVAATEIDCCFIVVIFFFFFLIFSLTVLDNILLLIIIMCIFLFVSNEMTLVAWTPYSQCQVCIHILILVFRVKRTIAVRSKDRTTDSRRKKHFNYQVSTHMHTHYVQDVLQASIDCSVFEWKQNSKF